MATTKAKSASKTKARKKPAAKKAAKITASVKTQGAKLVLETTPEQQQAVINAYVTLRNANLPIPGEIAFQAEALIASSQQLEEEERNAYENSVSTEQKAIEQANEEGPKWIRNAHNMDVAIRLDRQDKKRRIELKPRGQRGDMFKIQDEDLEDPSLADSIERGIVHVVGDGDAKAILSRQTHNMGRQHTPLALLRNEKGEPYAPEAIKVEAEFNSQGVVVAQLDPSLGEQHENVRSWKSQKGGGLIRADGSQGAAKAQAAIAQQQTVEQFIPTGGNPAIISSGFQPDAETRARISDNIARKKGVQGRPEDVLGGLSVTVDPPQRN